MKFQRIGTITPIARTAIFSMLLLAGALAHAADDDLPPPTGSDTPAPRSSVGPAKTTLDSAALSEEENIPAPSLGGDEALPEPSVDKSQERARNQVNKAPDDDEIFLPTPNSSDNIYYAPVGATAPQVSRDMSDWRSSDTNRPMFSLYAGLGFKTYANNYVKTDRTTGYSVGASVRMLTLSQVLFLHAVYRFSSYDVGDVNTVANVHDNTQHMGGMLELGVGRRLSLFASLLRRQTMVSSTGTAMAYQIEQKADLDGIGEEPSWYLGLGAQWDFYVIPHGSVGVHLDVEQDLYVLTLSFSMEPKPRQKLSLNYGSMDE